MALAGLACAKSTPTRSSLRVATWNLHDFLRSDADADAPSVASAPYVERLAQIAGVLWAIDADVVVVQEVGGRGELDDLVQAIGGYEPWSLPGNDSRGIHVGVLSRAPPETVVSHRADTFDAEGAPVSDDAAGAMRYARDCLELRFGGTAPWLLLGVHFKSKAEPDDPVRRLAEARHTRRLADACAACARVLIAGDFNDVPGAPAVEAIRGAPPLQYRDAGEVLAHAWTYEHAGERELIDHLFASPTLASELVDESVMIEHSASTVRASDHAPLVASFEWGDD